jgi:hypothetical protein
VTPRTLLFLLIGGSLILLGAALMFFAADAAFRWDRSPAAVAGGALVAGSAALQLLYLAIGTTP